MFRGVPGADGVAGGQAGHQRHYHGDESGRRRQPPGDPPSPAALFQDIVTGAISVTVWNGHPSNLFRPSPARVRGEAEGPNVLPLQLRPGTARLTARGVP